jgi:HSP20 family protein
MIRDLATLQDRMNRLFNETFPSRAQKSPDEDDFFTSDFAPAVDIYEDANAITLKADIPGMDPNQIDIRVEGNRLVLKGERNLEKESKRENFYRMERAYGSFTRIFALPQNVAADQIEANYKNGVLNLTIPKKEEAKPKHIKVRTEESGHTTIKSPSQTR